jgi:hypothetical protein
MATTTVSGALRGSFEKRLAVLTSQPRMQSHFRAACCRVRCSMYVFELVTQLHSASLQEHKYGANRVQHAFSSALIQAEELGSATSEVSSASSDAGQLPDFVTHICSRSASITRDLFCTFTRYKVSGYFSPPRLVRNRSLLSPMTAAKNCSVRKWHLRKSEGRDIHSEYIYIYIYMCNCQSMHV